MTFPAAGKFSTSQPCAPTAWRPTPQNRLSQTDFPKVFQRLWHLCPTEALPWQSNLIWKPRILLLTTSETFQLSPAAIHIPGPPKHGPMPGSLSCLMGTSVLLLLVAGGGVLYSVQGSVQGTTWREGQGQRTGERHCARRCNFPRWSLPTQGIPWCVGGQAGESRDREKPLVQASGHTWPLPATLQGQRQSDSSSIFQFRYSPFLSA